MNSEIFLFQHLENRGLVKGKNLHDIGKCRLVSPDFFSTSDLYV